MAATLTLDLTAECGRFQPLVTGIPCRAPLPGESMTKQPAVAAAVEQVREMLADAGFERGRGSDWYCAAAGRIANVAITERATGPGSVPTEVEVGVKMWVWARDNHGHSTMLNRPLDTWPTNPDGTLVLSDPAAQGRPTFGRVVTA